MLLCLFSRLVGVVIAVAEMLFVMDDKEDADDDNDCLLIIGGDSSLWISSTCSSISPVG